jgi:hypothetical protein
MPLPGFEKHRVLRGMDIVPWQGSEIEWDALSSSSDGHRTSGFELVDELRTIDSPSVEYRRCHFVDTAGIANLQVEACTARELRILQLGSSQDSTFKNTP